MAEEKEQKCKIVGGVLTGFVYCTCGTPSIGMDINGSKIVLNADEAGIVFNQLGDLLDKLGYFDEDEEAASCGKLH